MHTLEKVDALENPDSITLPLQKVPLGGDAGFWIDNDIRGMSLEQPGGAPEVGLPGPGEPMIQAFRLRALAEILGRGVHDELLGAG